MTSGEAATTHSPIRSTMQDDYQLTVGLIFERGRSIFFDSKVATFDGDRTRRNTYADVGGRAERLAAGLARLGISRGDAVGSFCWNNQEHLEAYFAIPCMGAVLHGLNPRLFPEQLAYVINHARDRAIIVDGSIAPLLAQIADRLETVEHFVVTGDGDTAHLPRAVSYTELVSAEQSGFAWPPLDERSPAGICYTTGTTGNPKGVVYSHRSTFLHSLAQGAAAVFGINEHDRILLAVPMFHANGWGIPYSGWLAGADFILPDRFVQAEPLCRLVDREHPTFSAGVPTVWKDVLRYAESNTTDFSSLRLIACGGSPVPGTLIEEFEKRHGVRIVQAWGMTETSPVGAVAHAPKRTAPELEAAWRSKTGRVCAGLELRLVDEHGNEVPWDGSSLGEIQVRGPWVTGTYHLDPSPEKFSGGWLRTGDVGSVDARGFVQIADRMKDVIKSGGEWISSVQLENELMAHPDVVEAAVVAVADERWEERPLACVVLRQDSHAEVEQLHRFLATRVASWWVPERWAVINEVPKTSVGKFDKKALRVRAAEGILQIHEIAKPKVT